MRDALPSGARIEIFDTLDSTSLEAKRRVASGAWRTQWIVALDQTAGYGRRGAAWRQQEGDVAATLVFRLDQEKRDLPQLSFVAALAAADAVRRFAPKADIRLKWPNDILVGEAKIAGLLLELLFATVREPIVCLGVGVNIVLAPPGLEYPTARLLDYCAGAPPTPLEFIAVLDEAFTAWRRRWEIEGFAPIREAWLAIAAGRGRRIRVQLPDQTLVGVFVDLDLAGALIVECEDGRRVVTAGSIIGF